MTGTCPTKKIIGVTMMIVGIVGLVFILFPLWLLLIYPCITLMFAVVAVIKLCSHSSGVSRAMEFLARFFLGAATITVIFFSCMIGSEFMHDSFTPRISDWLCFGSLIVPQLLWFPRLRSSPLASLLIALASSGPIVEIWGGSQSSS